MWNSLPLTVAKLSIFSHLLSILKSIVLANTRLLYDIVVYTYRELLTYNCAVNIFSVITIYCTIEHYS